MRSITGKVVMITGASSGIGEVTARLLASHGAKLVLGARRTDRLDKLVEEFGGADNAVAVATDVTSAASVVALFEHGIAAFGRVDALINNAGIAPLSMLKKGKTEDWSQTIDVNIKGVLHGINAVQNHMLERGNGQIVNMCSVSGIAVAPGFTVYAATKFAVRAISDGLRQECAGKIQVTNISPGMFKTEIQDQVTDSSFQQVREYADRVAQPAERVAEAVLFSLQQDPGVSVTELTIRPIDE